MTGVAYQLGERPNQDVEIIVHVDNELGETQRGDLVEFLTATDGILTAEFCPLRYHLMLVQYDRERINSQDVLQRVKARQIDAQLIGPV